MTTPILILSFFTVLSLIPHHIIKEFPNDINLPAIRNREVLSWEVKCLPDKLLKTMVFNNLKSYDIKTIETLIQDGAPAAKATSLPPELTEKISGVSYDPRCIFREDLALLTIIHWGFDNAYHYGHMIVHKKLANELIEIFTELLQAHYPIEKIKLIDEYDANDEKSMEDNNSSALCYRVVTGDEHKKNPRWSKHSFGTAIDINPLQNPYIKPAKNLLLPKNSYAYINRTINKKGMIIKNDACYKAFVSRGWIWGGDWDTKDALGRVDYQHFEKDLNNL